MLTPLMDKYDSFILTEKTEYSADFGDRKAYYLRQINRKERFRGLKLVRNAFKSLFVYLKERPTVIVTTGVLAVLPMCLLMKKIFHKKLIFIESFAKVTSPTQTGKFLYKYADKFYVQWESMLGVYPNATYLGGIY